MHRKQLWLTCVGTDVHQRVSKAPEGFRDHLQSRQGGVNGLSFTWDATDGGKLHLHTFLGTLHSFRQKMCFIILLLVLWMSLWQISLNRIFSAFLSFFHSNRRIFKTRIVYRGGWGPGPVAASGRMCPWAPARSSPWWSGQWWRSRLRYKSPPRWCHMPAPSHPPPG